MLLQAVTTLERHVAKLRSRVEDRVFSLLNASLSPESRRKLESVLTAPEGGHPSLTFINDEAKRRRTLTQLNRGEDRHKLARAVFHGKRGELRQRYREGQEDQLGALGLVVNVIILWNTLSINAALDQLAAEGHQLDPDYVARLSPLVFSHINLLGRYAFAVPEAVSRGELRPLRNPADALDDVA